MDALLIAIYFLAFGAIFWLLLTFKKSVYGTAFICLSLFCFYQYAELRRALDNVCSTDNGILKIIEDCDQIESYQNMFLFSGIGSTYFGLYLMFKK